MLVLYYSTLYSKYPVAPLCAGVSIHGHVQCTATRCSQYQEFRYLKELSGDVTIGRLAEIYVIERSSDRNSVSCQYRSKAEDSDDANECCGGRESDWKKEGPQSTRRGASVILSRDIGSQFLHPPTVLFQKSSSSHRCMRHWQDPHCH